MSPPRSPSKKSNESQTLTTKEYILVNLSKIIVEITGTAILSLFYFTM